MNLQTSPKEFRCWDTEKKKWVLKEVYLRPDGKLISVGVEQDDRYGFIEEHVEEHLIKVNYTGSKDKEGKKIFEGDILREANPAEDESVWGPVVWRMFSFMVEDSAGYLTNLWDFENSLVIGNIFENPELLEEK